jgi:parallel beta-helix repeat protein
VTVTGGERDTSRLATDGAVVVKGSNVLLSGCVFRGNIGDSVVVSQTVAGISGVVGRELSNLTIRDCRILQNSWDGIALYRGSRALIEGNLIDGVEMARGAQVGGGRGVGIGLTWNADADIRGNLIRNYWKGIGIFVNAQAHIQENVVEHVATWGMSMWDAGGGKPAAYFLRNIVYDTGACGVSLIRSTEGAPFPGRFVNNILVQTGQDPRYDSGEPYCFQEPLARHAVPSDFAISENVLYENRTPEDLPAPGDLSAEMFHTRVRTLVGRFGEWPMLEESDFWRVFVATP